MRALQIIGWILAGLWGGQGVLLLLLAPLTYSSGRYVPHAFGLLAIGMVAGGVALWAGSRRKAKSIMGHSEARG